MKPADDELLKSFLMALEGMIEFKEHHRCRDSALSARHIWRKVNRRVEAAVPKLEELEDGGLLLTWEATLVQVFLEVEGTGEISAWALHSDLRSPSFRWASGTEDGDVASFVASALITSLE